VPDRLATGERAEFAAVVTNPADRPADGTVALTVGERTPAERTVRLAPGESTTLTATTGFERAGEYTVAVGDRSTTLRVRDPTPTPASGGGSDADGDRATTADDGRTDRGTDGAGGGGTTTRNGGGADTATPMTPSGASGDGFGVVAALAGLAAVTLLRSRLR
jgi:hypothetical protein